MKNIYLLFCLIIGYTFSTHGQNIVKIEYYLDNDPGVGAAVDVPITAATSITNHTFEVPMTNVSDGFHRLHIRTKDENNNWSMIAQHQFLRTTIISQNADPIPNITRLEYYIDNDPGYGLATEVPISAGQILNAETFNVPMNSLSDGFHRIHVRAKDQNGNWSMVSQHQFLRTTLNLTPPPSIPNIVKLEYFIDNDPGFGLATNVPVSTFQSINNQPININITGKSLGNHFIQVRAKDSQNNWSIVLVRSFTVAEQAILIGGTPQGWCTSQPLNIPVQAYGVFNNGNIFTASLYSNSDAFIANLGALVSTVSGAIIGQLPSNLSLGSYKIRITSSSPTLSAYPEIPIEIQAECPPPCPTSKTLTSPVDNISSGQTNTIQTNNTNGFIEASNKILNNGTTATYEAGRYILLTNGFLADKGTVFIAQKGGCE
jgi:hypothetical protein